MLLQALCETYLCISITADTAGTPKKSFKNARVCISEGWWGQRAVNLAHKSIRGE